MPDLRLSVVVASAGRPRALARCLTGLSQMRSTRFEVIVVADRDGYDVARSLPFADRLTVLEQSDLNISMARNMGIAAATGEAVAFIDDDAVPEPTWAEALLRRFADTSEAAVTGPVLGRNGISLQWGRMATDTLGRDRWLSADAADGPGPGEVLKLHGTNMAVRRDALDDVGGFDPAFAFYLDETDLARRLVASGHTLGFVEQVVVHHGFAASSRRTEARVPLDLFDIGASTAVFLRKHAAADTGKQALETLVAEQRSRLLRLAKKRKIDARQMRSLMESLEAGIQAGKSRQSQTVRFSKSNGAFRAMRNDLPADMECLSGWRHRARSLRAAALARTRADQPTTVLVFDPTPRRLKVSFTDGGWWEHSGGLYGVAKRSEPAVQFWTLKARVRAEIERVSDLRGFR